MTRQGTLHSFLLSLLPPDKRLPDYSFYPSDLEVDKPERAL